jgi:hypothetical protein
MKKNIVLSSVAAVAVAGMLALSGCGGNSGSNSGSNNNTFNPAKMANNPSEKSSAKANANGESKRQSGDQGGKNAFTYQIRSVAGEGCEDADKTVDECPAEKVKSCEILAQDADESNNCGVEVERRCTDEGEKLDYKSESISSAFAALDASGVVATAGKDLRYAGFLNVFTDDDFDSCKLYITADLDCSLGRDNRGIYINKDTTPENSRVVVLVTGKDENGNDVTRTVTGTVQYHDAEKKHAYVKFEDDIAGIDISGIDSDLKVTFFVEENDVIPDSSDVWSGATGGTASGAGN